MEFIQEFSSFPFNLQPDVNKILGFLVLQLQINLSCFDCFLVSLPLQNQSERAFFFVFVFSYCSNELSVMAQRGQCRVNGGSFVISPESGLDVQCSALHGTKCPNLRLGWFFFAFFFFK